MNAAEYYNSLTQEEQRRLVFDFIRDDYPTHLMNDLQVQVDKLNSLELESLSDLFDVEELRAYIAEVMNDSEDLKPLNFL